MRENDAAADPMRRAWRQSIDSAEKKLADSREKLFIRNIQPRKNLVEGAQPNVFFAVLDIAQVAFIHADHHCKRAQADLALLPKSANPHADFPS